MICVPYNLIFYFSYCIFEVMSLNWLQSGASLKSVSSLWSYLLCFFSVSAASPRGWLALDTSANQSLFSLRPVHWLVTTHKGALHLGTWLCPRTSLIVDRQVGLLLPEPISSPCLLPFYPVLYCYGWESGPERIEYCFPSHHSCVWMLRMQAI